jgi:cystathionine beta-lyase/cystathionine gamma-synthase
VVCRPLELGADLVLESLTKIMNGHSDVVLGLLAGHTKDWDRVGLVLSKWGLASSPMDCWLALRGISTLALRAKAAGTNAQQAAEFLRKQPGVQAVRYPGLEEHTDRALAERQFGESFGSIVTFTLAGGLPAAEKFISAGQIPFCPSLGELTTTLSHPASTSHRGLSSAARAALGIDGGTIRLSVGIESPAAILEMLSASLSQSG